MQNPLTPRPVPRWRRSSEESWGTRAPGGTPHPPRPAPQAPRERERRSSGAGFSARRPAPDSACRRSPLSRGFRGGNGEEGDSRAWGGGGAPPSLPLLYPFLPYFLGGWGGVGLFVCFHFTMGASAKCSLRSCPGTRAGAAARPAFGALQPRPPFRLSPPAPELSAALAPLLAPTKLILPSPRLAPALDESYLPPTHPPPAMHLGRAGCSLPIYLPRVPAPVGLGARGCRAALPRPVHRLHVFSVKRPPAAPLLPLLLCPP